MSNEWTEARDTSIHPAGDDRVPLAIAAGLVAALVGGAIWAAIGIFADLEVGWVAWGIGVLVGGAMAATTTARSRQLAVTAAALALVGLLAGKAMTFAGSAGPIAAEMAADADYMRGMTAWKLYADGALEPEVQQAVARTEASGDTLSDALWADMLASADVALAAFSADQKLAMAREAADRFIEDIGLVGGVRAQISGFDVLWLFLALATAFRLMNPARPEPAAALGAPARDDAPPPA